MTQDEIIEMAEACGFTRTHSGEVRLWLSNSKDLETFAKLVAEKEREACALICDARATEYDGFTEEQNASEKLAEAIRARRQA